jgi:HSP20 family protein
MMKITKYNACCPDTRYPVEASVSSMLNDLMGWSRNAALSSWAPNVDIVESEGTYQIHAELPGITEEEVNVSLNNNILTLSGEKKQEIKDEKDNFVRVERTYGKFERSFSLPSNIVADKVDASYKDGVLTVTIPKAEEAKSHTIKIKR